MTAVLGLGIS
jgi:hypothetical protein